MPTRLLLVAGIRSQFIKMASFLDALDKHNRTSSCQLSPVRINTGQHYDDLLYRQLIMDLNLSFDFQITHDDRTAEGIFAHSFVELSKIFDRFDPTSDIVVVFGDGNPTAVGALVAARKGYKLIHVEAGEKRAKHEHEEINRRIVDALADIYFCVSKRSIKCLATEGKTDNVYWTGDLAFDFLKTHLDDLHFEPSYKLSDFILATIHRPENLKSDVLSNIIQALSGFSKKVLFVCHPKTKHQLQELQLLEIENITYVDALSYSGMLMAIKNSAFIFTDSGGIIREASHLGKRCVVRRDEGGWAELMQAGYNIRVGTNLKDLEQSLIEMNSLAKIFAPPPEVLHRQGGAKYALEIICDLAKSMKGGDKHND